MIEDKGAGKCQLPLTWWASIAAEIMLTFGNNTDGRNSSLHGRVETESGGTRRRMGGEVKGKEVNGVGSQKSSA